METCDCPTTEDVAAFLSNYASWLFGSGATCIRLEKNVSRIAKAYGLNVEITIMPRHLHLHIGDGSARITAIVAPQRIPTSFSINTQLSRLSWQIADGEISFAEALESFCKTIGPSPKVEWLLTALVCAANASFCRLFGGDIAAMAIVAMATFAGFSLKGMLTARKWDVRIVVFLCAFVSSVLGATGLLFSIGDTPGVAMATCALYLVPGIPYLNSFSDFIYRHYICSFGRFADATVLTCCLSAGLYAGMVLMDVDMF